MSSIGSSGFPPVNPYAGSLRSSSDSEAARNHGAERSTQSDQRIRTEALAGTSEPEASGDRDADGFDGGRGLPVNIDEENPDAQAAPAHPGSGRPKLIISPASHLPGDDQCGQVLDVDV
jgi:hypothetical protein